MATRPRSSASTAASPGRDAVLDDAQTPPGTETAAPSPQAPPPGLKIAAAAQAAEALVLFVAAVFAAVATFTGKSYERSSGIALTLIAVGTAAGFAAFAVGLFRARPWTRTPVVMSQLFVGGAGIYLLDGHRYEWAIPTLALAVICLVGVFLPASLHALNRPPVGDPDPAPAPMPQPRTPQPTKAQPAKPQPAKPQPAKPQPAKPQPAKPQPAKTQRNTRPGQSTKRPSANRKRKPRR